MIAWIIFDNKLLSSFLMSAIYSLLKCLCYRQTQKCNIENTWFGSPLHYQYLDPSPPLSFDSYLGTTGLDQLTSCCVKLRQQVFLNSSA